MKVFLASLIPLLACLLLLSEVKCRRRVREDDEYEVSHIRKREMKFKEYFERYNDALTCLICENEYDIDAANCVKVNHKAKHKCMLKVKNNRPFFESKWIEMTTANSDRPSNVTEFFSPMYLNKTCKICGEIGSLSEADCLIGEEVARRYCEETMDEMHVTFDKVWNLTSLSPTSKIRHYSKRSITLKNYLGGNNLQICSICQKYFGIDEARCIKNTPKETHDCWAKVKESQAFLEFNWTKWNSPEAGQPGDVVDFSENEKNLGEMCSVCDHLFHFSSSDCVVRKEGIRQKCQNWFNEYWKLMQHTKK